MKQIEMEDYEDYMQGGTENRHRIFLKYLKQWEDTIRRKGVKFKRYIRPDEIQSDAVMAIDLMFEEVGEKLEEVHAKINLFDIFCKYLSRTARENEANNQPLTRAIKTNFKNTVAKTKKKHIYEGYETSSPVSSETTLVDVDYTGSDEHDRKAQIKDLIHVIAPDDDSPIHQDLCARFIDGHTMRQIAESPRNEGMSKQGVAKRLGRYMEKIGFKIKQEKFNLYKKEDNNE